MFRKKILAVMLLLLLILCGTVMTASAANQTSTSVATHGTTAPSTTVGPAKTVGAGTAPGWMFHADETHSGVYDAGGSPNNVQKWSFPTTGEVASSPSVVNGVV